MIDISTIRPTELTPGAPYGPLKPPTTQDPPRLWLVRTETFLPYAAQRAAAVLDEEEQGRVAHIRHPGNRDAYLTAHVALRQLLGSHLDVRPADVPLTRQPCVRCAGPHGRPGVAGDPLHFSLSHSPELTLIALAATPVGADIEPVPTSGAALDVIGQLHPREAEELSHVPPPELPRAFARVWTRKEAYLKGIGTGLSRPVSADYVGTTPAPARLPGWTLTDVPVPATHAAALATTTP